MYLNLDICSSMQEKIVVGLHRVSYIIKFTCVI